MSRVVAMLSGDVEVNKEIPKPGYFNIDWEFNDVSGLASSSIASKVSDADDNYLFASTWHGGRWRTVMKSTYIEVKNGLNWPFLYDALLYVLN